MASVTHLAFPPKAYSVGDANFDPSLARRLRVFIDGVEVREVSEYDCDAGYVVRLKLDRDGKITANLIKGEVETERLEGVVTVDWNDGGRGA